MKRSKIVAWDFAVIIAAVLFLSTKNWDHVNLVIGFETVIILIFSLKHHLDYYKIAGKIY